MNKKEYTQVNKYWLLQKEKPTADIPIHAA